MEYKVLSAPSPLGRNLEQKIIASGKINLPAIDPNETGKAKMDLPSGFYEGDILEIKAWDIHNKEICTWTWPIKYAGDYTQKQIELIDEKGKASVSLKNDLVKLSASGVTVSFNVNDGLISDVTSNGNTLSFNNGPLPVGMKARLKETKFRQEEDKAVFTAYYMGAVDSIRWEMMPSGLLSMHAVTLNNARAGQGFDEAIFEDNISSFGFTFSYPEEKVEKMEWFGRGPYRVWRNRIKGTNYGIWEKDYNNTITGADYENLVYPEFKGYHSNLYWSTLVTSESPFSVYSASDGVFLRVFTPAEPTDNKTNWSANPEFPEGDISFLYEIPAIRCFKPISQQGPNSQPSNIRIKIGDEGIHMNLWFDFRDKKY